jgi:putative transposase
VSEREAAGWESRLPRRARVIVPGHPHHVTQRGHKKAQVFFTDEDYRDYLRILREETARNGVSIWAYCLMPNHVHLVVSPSTKEGLGRAVGETARRYARTSNLRHERDGHVWHTRYYSVVMDERHLLEAVRYVLLNPVRANLRKSADSWPWSSYAAHAVGTDDVIDAAPMASRIGSVAAFVAVGIARDAAEVIRSGTLNGRPLGDERFVHLISAALGRNVAVRPRGRPRTRPTGTARAKAPQRENSRDGA